MLAVPAVIVMVARDNGEQQITAAVKQHWCTAAYVQVWQELCKVVAGTIMAVWVQAASRGQNKV